MYIRTKTTYAKKHTVRYSRNLYFRSTKLKSTQFVPNSQHFLQEMSFWCRFVLLCGYNSHLYTLYVCIVMCVYYHCWHLFPPWLNLAMIFDRFKFIFWHTVIYDFAIILLRSMDWWVVCVLCVLLSSNFVFVRCRASAIMNNNIDHEQSQIKKWVHAYLRNRG